MAGVLSVAELLNLFVDSEVVPDVIIGPSHYAIEHGSLEVNVTMQLHSATNI